MLFFLPLSSSDIIHFLPWQICICITNDLAPHLYLHQYSSWWSLLLKITDVSFALFHQEPESALLTVWSEDISISLFLLALLASLQLPPPVSHTFISLGVENASFVTSLTMSSWFYLQKVLLSQTPLSQSGLPQQPWAPARHQPSLPLPPSVSPVSVTPTPQMYPHHLPR